MTNSIIVFLAGGCGSVLRYLVGLTVPSRSSLGRRLGLIRSVVSPLGFSARWRRGSAGAKA